MLPGAGLFLRGTLLPKPSTHLTDSDSGNMRQKSFERRSSDESRPDSSHIQITFKFADFLGALSDVSAENRIFAHLIQRVRQDVIEAMRLYNCPAVMEHFEDFPWKRTRIDGIMLDVQQALNDIGLYVTAKMNDDKLGSAKRRHRFEWVLGDRQKLMTRQYSLTTCHTSLMGAVQMMQMVEVGGGPLGSGADAPIPIEFDDVRPTGAQDDIELSLGPHARKKWRRMSERKVSVPIISISDAESSVSAEAELRPNGPFELEGSTPSEENENWDLYLPPPKTRKSFENIKTLPTVPEKHPELHELSALSPITSSDSTLSLQLPNPTQLQRRPVVKHNSLPTRLPGVPRTPSLYAELSKYVLPPEIHQPRESIYWPDDSTPSSSTTTTSPSDSIPSGTLTAATSPSDSVREATSPVMAPATITEKCLNDLNLKEPSKQPSIPSITKPLNDLNLRDLSKQPSVSDSIRAEELITAVTLSYSKPQSKLTTISPPKERTRPQTALSSLESPPLHPQPDILHTRAQSLPTLSNPAAQNYPSSPTSQEPTQSPPSKHSTTHPSSPSESPESIVAEKSQSLPTLSDPSSPKLPSSQEQTQSPTSIHSTIHPTSPSSSEPTLPQKSPPSSLKSLSTQQKRRRAQSRRLEIAYGQG